MAQNKHDVIPLDLLQVQHVPAMALHSVWHLLRSDLEHCLTQDTDHPLVEDIYGLVKAGTWGLYIGTVRNAYVGFTILQMAPEWNGGKRCHLLYVSGPGFMDLGYDFVVKLAKEHGCSRITFRASKEGFRRLTARLGFKPTSREYELRI